MKIRKLNIRTIAAICCMAAVGFASVPNALAQTKATENITEIKDKMFYSRAVEAVIWGMPMVNFEAMRQAYFRDAGAKFNDVIYFSQFANWKFQTTTPNNSTNYVMFFTNLKDGPVVVDVPAAEDAALFGSFITSRTVPLIDVGNTGADKGKGGKYLLLPPDYKGNVPAGYTSVPSNTFNVYSLLRVIPKSDQPKDVENAIAYLRKLKIYPLNKPTQEIRYIDVYDKPFEGISRYGLDYYELLAGIVQEEPVETMDLITMDQLNTIGIAKNTPFSPDAKAKSILEKAVNDAHAFMLDGLKTSGMTWWEGKRWQYLAPQEWLEIAKKGKRDYNGRFLADQRSFIYYGAFGPVKNATNPNLYIKTFVDGDGVQLNGSNTYKLNVPANIPSTQFWSVIAQNTQTAGFIRNAQSVGVNSFQNLKKNADGSVDVYFSPQAPKGYESNWVSTAEGQDFFLLFRNYGATKEVLNRTSPWTLNDLVKVK